MADMKTRVVLGLLAACGLATAGWAFSDDPGGVQAAGEGPGAPPAAAGGEKKDKDDDSGLKPFAEVSKGYDKVVSTADGQSFYTLWQKKKDSGLLAELPRGYENQKHFIALTVASGEEYAGLHHSEMLVYWRKQDNRLLLIEPNVDTKSTGDPESKSSVQRLFTDRVVLDVPILSTGPSGGPVIDMKELLSSRVSQFFGYSASGAQPRLAELKGAKAFPQNIEVGYEMPTSGGRLKEFHYSISLLRGSPGYKPREADERVGYFTTVSRDLGKFTDQEKWVRYINRWSLEKRDPKLKMSPPKEPITFYLEHTVPVRYRRWVRDGLLDWNKAFEKVGIIDAVRVEQQDAETGAHMEKDPEDVRFNFVRWLSNDIGTAIGPSRVNPYTGEILDADIILTDGWIRHFWVQFNQVMPELAMESFTPETLAWLDRRPQWDPRIRMADPAKRDYLIAQRAGRGVVAYGGHPIAMADPELRGDRWVHSSTGSDAGSPSGLFAGLTRTSQFNSLCMAGRGKAMDMSFFRMMAELYTAEELEALEPGADEGEKKKDDKKEDKKDDKPKQEMLDGVPEWFVGPMMRDLTGHEVGHTLGLRHNFKASSIYSLAQINSDEVKGKKPFTGSVMDYTAANLSVKDGKLIGDITMIDIGPYDFWAIEYGYTFADTKDVLKRVAEPELIYGTDEDTIGPDPRSRRYDFSKNPLEYASQRYELAKYHRTRLIDKFVKDGESWAKVRRGYTLTLGMQTSALSMMANWVGGVYVNRDRKGDPNGRTPTEVVAVDTQRDALRWTIDHAFYDEAFGLTPELLEKMTVDKWMDNGGWNEAMQEPAWPIHDRIGGIQSSVLTMLMNPSTLRRVYDNEFRVASDKDALTLAELMDSVGGSIWSEIEKAPGDRFTARKPMISSLRRNLQQEHAQRLIDLTFPDAGSGEAYKPIKDLAIMQLRRIMSKIDGVIGKDGKNGNTDPYTHAHLADLRTRIEKALSAEYIYNANQMGGNPFGFFFHAPEEGSPRK